MCLMNSIIQELDYWIVIHLVSTVFMVGLIWIVQLVHYPSFSFVDKSLYRDFQYFHMQRITYIVAPVMVIELLSASVILYKYYMNWYFSLSILVLALIWVNTALLNIPVHNKLLANKDEMLINKLVLYNWPRTILWSLRVILLIFFIF